MNVFDNTNKKDLVKQLVKQSDYLMQYIKNMHALVVLFHKKTVMKSSNQSTKTHNDWEERIVHE